MGTQTDLARAVAALDAERAETARLRAEVASLLEQVRLLSEASLDLAGVALDNRAPGDQSTRGVRP